MTPELLATLTLFTASGVYALACWLYPFGKCRTCKGTGTRQTLIRKKFKPCRSCSASGLKLRYGRRLFNYGRKVVKGQ
ncbi:hypothetical protein [Catelliglobosispora koreensis]|uniref:hypothetical protein n=1 Tax=Catelliglobosispora koreensis TaxID=129052 RepID=UPI00037FD130|nr:hypothetical protein [Catelliglobosispora koreensis]